MLFLIWISAAGRSEDSVEKWSTIRVGGSWLLWSSFLFGGKGPVSCSDLQGRVLTSAWTNSALCAALLVIIEYWQLRDIPQGTKELNNGRGVSLCHKCAREHKVRVIGPPKPSLALTSRHKWKFMITFFIIAQHKMFRMCFVLIICSLFVSDVKIPCTSWKQGVFLCIKHSYLQWRWNN